MRPKRGDWQAGDACLSLRTVIDRRLAACFVLTLVGAAAILAAMGRPLLCQCGYLDLWGQVGPEQSQMLADWYSPSHVIHGLLFYAALRFVPGWSERRRFCVALGAETAWEMVENTPWIIDRYREATAALGYTGDSIVNSLSDIAMMAAGYALARRLPVWASVALVIALELVALAAVRDNLTLNVWMLLFPTDFIRDWQAGA